MTSKKHTRTSTTTSFIINNNSSSDDEDEDSDIEAILRNSEPTFSSQSQSPPSSQENQVLTTERRKRNEEQQQQQQQQEDKNDDDEEKRNIMEETAQRRASYLNLPIVRNITSIHDLYWHCPSSSKRKGSSSSSSSSYPYPVRLATADEAVGLFDFDDDDKLWSRNTTTTNKKQKVLVQCLGVHHGDAHKYMIVPKSRMVPYHGDDNDDDSDDSDNKNNRLRPRPWCVALTQRYVDGLSKRKGKTTTLSDIQLRVEELYLTKLLHTVHHHERQRQQRRSTTTTTTSKTKPRKRNQTNATSTAAAVAMDEKEINNTILDVNVADDDDESAKEQEDMNVDGDGDGNDKHDDSKLPSPSTSCTASAAARVVVTVLPTTADGKKKDTVDTTTTTTSSRNDDDDDDVDNDDDGEDGVPDCGEKLRAGDVIEYTHPQFVCGHVDGYRRTRIVAIGRKYAPQNIRLENGELLDNDHPIRRIGRLLRNKVIPYNGTIRAIQDHSQMQGSITVDGSGSRSRLAQEAERVANIVDAKFAKYRPALEATGMPMDFLQNVANVTSTTSSHAALPAKEGGEQEEVSTTDNNNATVLSSSSGAGVDKDDVPNLQGCSDRKRKWSKLEPPTSNNNGRKDSMRVAGGGGSSPLFKRTAKHVRSQDKCAKANGGGDNDRRRRRRLECLAFLQTELTKFQQQSEKQQQKEQSGRRRGRAATYCHSVMTEAQLELAIQVWQELECRSLPTTQDDGDDNNDVVEFLSQEIDVELYGLEKFLSGDPQRLVRAARHAETEVALQEWMTNLHKKTKTNDDEDVK